MDVVFKQAELDAVLKVKEARAKGLIDEKINH